MEHQSAKFAKSPVATASIKGRVQLVKGRNRLFVYSDYDNEFVKLIRKVDIRGKRYWSAEKKEWSLPLECYDPLCEALNDKEYPYSTVFTDSRASIVPNAQDVDMLDVSFDHFIEDFKTFLTLDDAVYDRERRILNVPIKQKEALFKKLDDQQIFYVVPSVFKTKDVNSITPYNSPQMDTPKAKRQKKVQIKEELENSTAL